MNKLEREAQYSSGFVLKNGRIKLYCYAESKKEAHEWLAKITDYHAKVATPKWRPRTRKRSAGAPIDRKLLEVSKLRTSEINRFQAKSFISETAPKQDSYYSFEIKVSEAKNFVPPGGTKFRSVITCDSEMDQTTLFHCSTDPANPIWAETFRLYVVLLEVI